MNESQPAMEQFAIVPPPPARFKDRSVGLIVFGIFTVLLGCLLGLMLLVTLAAGKTAQATAATPPPAATYLFIGVIYGPLAVALIWLGIGSILARRWARALLLIFSWSWLIAGLALFATALFFLPKIFANLAAAAPPGQPSLPAGTMQAMLIVLFAVYGIIFLLLPGVWTFFYSGKNVKATCEAKQAYPSWTDATPLPVLAASLLQTFGAVMLLVIPLVNHAVFPFFGVILSGLTGTVFCLLIAGLLGSAAWMLYRLDVRGWWIMIISLCILTASSLVTYARLDVMQMYRLMGYTQAQIDPIQKTGLLTGNNFFWFTLISMVPYVGYILWIKRFFRRII